MSRTSGIIYLSLSPHSDPEMKCRAERLTRETGILNHCDDADMNKENQLIKE